MKRSLVSPLLLALLVPLGCDLAPAADYASDWADAQQSDQALDPKFKANPSAPAAPSLRLLLTDAPADVDAVFVTFDRVEVQTCGADPDAEDCADGGWVTVTEEEVTFELLSLAGGVTAELGLAELEAGFYGQVRLHMTDASVVSGGEEFALTVPSGELKLNGGFDLEDGMETEVTIDFDAGHSVHRTGNGNWMLQPVISVISTTVAPLEDATPDDGGEEPADGGEDPPDGDTQGTPEDPPADDGQDPPPA